jgi:MFS family permease
MERMIHPEVQTTTDRYLRIVLLDSLIAGLYYVLTTLHSGLKFDPRSVFATLTSIMLWSAFWEIVTGWFADVFTRRAAAVSSFLSVGAAGVFLAMHPAETKGLLPWDSLSWQATLSLYALGGALISGALEAWLYDRHSYYSSEDPDLVVTYRKEMVLTILGTGMGYLLGVLVLIILLILPNVTDAELAHMLPHYGAYGVAGFALVGLVLAWRMPEEYWIREEHRHSQGLAQYVLRFLRILLTEKRRYGTFVLLYSVAYSMDMLFTFSVWPLLWFSVERSGAAVGTHKTFVLLALTFVAVSSVGAYAARTWGARSKLLSIPAARVRAAHLLLASAWNFLPMVAVGAAVLFLSSTPWSVLPVLVVSVLVYRLGLVMRQGIYKAVLQRTVVDSSHRAVLLSAATAAGSVLCGCSAAVYLRVMAPVEDARSVLALSWILAPILGLVLIAVLVQPCRSWLAMSTKTSIDSTKA